MYQRIPDLEKQERADQSQNVLQSTSNVCNVSIFAVFVNRLAASMVGCTELGRWIVWTLTLDHMPELFRWDCNDQTATMIAFHLHVRHCHFFAMSRPIADTLQS